MYDYLIVGAGLSGAIFAYEATKRGKKVKVIDKRDHIGGNIYCEEVVFLAVCPCVFRSMANDLRRCGNLLSARRPDCYHLFPPRSHDARHYGLFQHCLRYGRHNLSRLHFRRSEDREGNTAHSPVEQHISELFGRRLLPFVGVRRIGIGTLDKDSRCYGQFVSARCPDCDGLVPPRYDFRDENGLFQHRLRHGRHHLAGNDLR